ncbi:hypothetical protein O9K51_04412 [Purpureocillium lavendulum]|uniref:N,N-dimethylformamidase beta subunit-like C-terminal domain-containing protein n=1 Tax=Purpureocillium lavendulum TaxID=1247861 RepID=A0AB34FUS9_9HYPO|nr:hypothetical protein O9K51_04412 [Purpureocillium lavendulum]
MHSTYPVPSDYPKEIIGYCEPWIANPGDTIDVKNGPEPRVEEIGSVPDGICNGRFQRAHPGSYGIVPDIGLDPLAHFGQRFTVYVQPWLTECDHVQALVSTLDPRERSGVAVVVDEHGMISVLVGQGNRIQTVNSGFAPACRRWTKVDLTARRDDLSLCITPLPHGLEPAQQPATLQMNLDSCLSLASSTQLYLAASLVEEQVDGISRLRPSNHFNGRLDSLTVEAIGECPLTLASYDFSVDIPSDHIVDTSGSNRRGGLVNAPSRAVKGRLWDGNETDWTKDPRAYGAIHFHEDDLDDAGWDTDFSVQVPKDARSGVYAVEIESTTSAVRDQVVFFVRPTTSGSKFVDGPRVALVMSTFTYLAYANEHQFDLSSPARVEVPGLDDIEFYKDETFHKQDRRRDLGLSCYDVHRDLSAVTYSSAKRPMLNCRPDYINWTGHRPRELSAELIMQGFLEQLGVTYDIVTDHDLHSSGARALEGYTTVITGCHPEYHTLESYVAYEEYLKAGGSHIVWRSGAVAKAYVPLTKSLARDTTRSTVVLAGSGEIEERLPITLLASGVAEKGQAQASTVYDVHLLATFTECVQEGMPDLTSWIFARLDTSSSGELVFGKNALGGLGGGASADEIDRKDVKYGSPANAIVLASSVGHPDTFGLFPEDVGFPMIKTLGTQTDLIRSDMVYYETSGGGAVFSIGSISWYCALGWNNYQNDVAIITENVIRRFSQSSMPSA